MKHASFFLLLASLLLTSCNTTASTTTTEPLTVQYTAASAPWLASVETCAGATVVKAEQRSADFLDLQIVDMAIRIGQPENLTIPAFQIDSEDILVIVNPQNPVNALSAVDVQGLFSGSIQTWQNINNSTAPVQVWVFASGEDVQQIFEQSALTGVPVTSNAHLAVSPDEMSQAIAEDVNAVGILPRHWKAGNVSDVFTVATVPVLAIMQGQPQGVTEEILSCLQK